MQLKPVLHYFNNVAGNDDKSACFVNWYVSNSPNGVYEEVSTAEKHIYFDTTFLNKYVYFEVIPVCPVTGFSGNTVRSLPFLVEYDSAEDDSPGEKFVPILDKVTVTDVKFSDIEKHWAKEYIEKLSSCGVVNGKTKDIFSPKDNVTRAEFSKMLSIAFNVRSRTELPLFDDVRPIDWHYDYVNSLYLSGIIKGTSPTQFSPKKSITREEAVVMMVRLFEKSGVKTGKEAGCGLHHGSRQHGPCGLRRRIFQKGEFPHLRGCGVFLRPRRHHWVHTAQWVQLSADSAYR